MTSPTTSPKSIRKNSLITIMCEIEGIQPPGEDAYTSDPPSPLTEKQVGIILKVIQNREATEESYPPEDEPDLGSEDKPLNCPQCDLRLKNVRTLKQHTGDVHIGTKCFWPSCNATTSTEIALNRHLKVHNDAAAVGIKNGRMTCNWPGCGKVYKYPDSVARHLRKHTTEARTAAS